MPGVSPSYFKVKFEKNLTSSEELNIRIEGDKKILDQLGNDLQMRVNAKMGSRTLNCCYRQ